MGNETRIQRGRMLTNQVALQVEMLYGVTIIIIGVFVRHLSQTMRIPVPYTVTVFLIGVVFGFLPMGAISDIGPYTIIIVFMPILIFEGAFSIDVYIFKQIFLQVLLLAFPALVVMIGMTAVISSFLFKEQKFDWKVSMMFASILSATDPVAVVSIMKELGVKKHLSLLIEGESMLNDGTAMVFFGIFRELIIYERDFNLVETLHRLVVVSTGGPAVGYVMARIAVFWLEWTFNDPLIEILITLGTSYLTFYIAEEFFGVSGVLAVVMCGVFISGHKTCISPEVESFLHTFWETLSFMANTLIFALSGLIISNKVLANSHYTDIVRLIILYIVIHVIRGLTIFMFSPILRRLGYGMTWQEGFVATWSGLRGAIGLSLALIVFMTHKDNSIGKEILFHVSLIVVLTLFINATSVSALLTFLGISGVSDETRLSMRKAIAVLEKGRERSLVIWRIDRFLSNSNWNLVRSFCTISDPYSNNVTEGQYAQDTNQITCPSCNAIVPHIPTPQEIHEMKAEAVRKYLKIFKKAIWEQFEHGTLSGYGAQRLDDMIEHAYDTDLGTVSVRAVKAIWKLPDWLHRVEMVIQCLKVCQPLPSSTDHRTKSPSHRAFYYWSRHWLLIFWIQGSLCAIVVTEISLYFVGSLHEDVIVGLDTCLWIMLDICSLYFIFRIMIFRLNYASTPWFYFNLAAIVMLASDLVIELSGSVAWFPAYYRESRVWQIEPMILVWRTAYILPVFELLNIFIGYQLTNKRLGLLRTFYNIAWAYINAVEKVELKLAHVIDFDEIRANIITHALDSKMDLTRELGLVQGFYPRIAIESKTSHSIRIVLNAMRDSVYDMKDEGRIDEVQTSIFIKVIESRMKRLLAAPPQIKEPTVQKILEGVPWIDNDSDIISFLHVYGKVMKFNTGDSIVKAGDSSELGIYFILRGLIKIESITMNFLNFLTSGNVVGEYSCLTGKPRNASLVCETPVSVLYMPKQSMERAIQVFSHLQPPLHERLWRMTAIRTASNILPTHSTYRGIAKQSLLRMLEDFHLEFVKSDTVDLRMIKDVLLIAGTATCDTDVVIEGPCLVDSHIHKLKFEPDQNPVLLYRDSYMA